MVRKPTSPPIIAYIWMWKRRRFSLFLFLFRPFGDWGLWLILFVCLFDQYSKHEFLFLFLFTYKKKKKEISRLLYWSPYSPEVGEFYLLYCCICESRLFAIGRSGYVLSVSDSCKYNFVQVFDLVFLSKILFRF